jgi:hypothetical protein
MAEQERATKRTLAEPVGAVCRQMVRRGVARVNAADQCPVIGTIDREFLDAVLFRNARDLERKLADFPACYNAARSTRHWTATRR